MATKTSKDKSLLECAIEAVSNYPKNQQPKTIYEIARDAMKIKGLKDDDQARELMPRFICDLMESGCFVYCGDNRWDLKENQPTSMLDKDVRDYEQYDADVIENELKSEGDIIETKEDTYESTEDIEPDNDDEMADIADSLGQGQQESETESSEVDTGYEEDEGEEDE